MLLHIDGEERPFTDLNSFRAQFGLGADFGVVAFEPKNLAGLGQIDGAGPQMTRLFNKTLAHLPGKRSLLDWLDFIPSLQAHFRDELEAVNPHIGLRPPEVEFAVAGLGDVCRALVYALIQAQAQGLPPPAFERIYRDWLYSTVYVSAAAHSYAHHGQAWTLHIISHAYGRVGLRIDTEAARYYVLDHQLACPAERFMEKLLRKIAEHLTAHII